MDRRRLGLQVVDRGGHVAGLHRPLRDGAGCRLGLHVVYSELRRTYSGVRSLVRTSAQGPLPPRCRRSSTSRAAMAAPASAPVGRPWLTSRTRSRGPAAARSRPPPARRPPPGAPALVEPDPGRARGLQHPPPVGVAAVDGRLDQRAVGDPAGHGQRLLLAAGPPTCTLTTLVPPSASASICPARSRQTARTASARSPGRPAPRRPRGQQQHRVVGRLGPVHGDPVEGGRDARRQRVPQHLHSATASVVRTASMVAWAPGGGELRGQHGRPLAMPPRWPPGHAPPPAWPRCRW